MVMDSPLPDSHLQMAFVERDEEVEALPTKTAAQPFANRIRLGRSHRRAQNHNAQIRQALVHLLGIDTIPVVNDESIWMTAGQPFPELLQHPLRCRMSSHIVVENSSGRDFYYDEDVKGCGKWR